jgi:nucleoside-diphosphate-sugar epimerase
MRIFLTGASGYIGLALCRRLAAEGHELRALVRETSNRQPLEELGATLFVGDITDRYSMREAMSGADWVVHAAAELDFEAPEDRMRRTNVVGSENVASLAYKLGVGRLLAISSIASFGGSPPDGSAADEEAPPILPMPTSYSATKREADEAIAAWAERGLRVNTVFPSLVYGPPGKKQGSNALLRMVLKGRMPAVVGGDRMVNLVHVDDLVDGICRAMARAEPGEGYILSGDAISIAELVQRVAELGDVRPPRLDLSVGSAALLMLLTRPWFALRGYRSPLSPAQLASLKRHWNFDDSKARDQLEWRPRSLAEGLPETLAYLARH